MNGRRHRLTDGRTLAWQEQGEGPPLVLLHGWSLSGAAFAELAALLPGYRLLLPDLPGHGDTAPAVPLSLASMADDLASWLDTEAPGPRLLGGWSLGGMVAMELAARPGSAVSRLALIATTPRFTSGDDWSHGLPAGQVQALRRNLARRFEATLGDFFELTFTPGEINGERLRAIRAFAVHAGTRPDPSSAAQLLAVLAEQDQRPLLPAIGCPALVVHGTADRVTPVGAGRHLAAALPQGELLELDGVGHAPFWSRPAAVAAALRGFATWDR